MKPCLGPSRRDVVRWGGTGALCWFAGCVPTEADPEPTPTPEGEDRPPEPPPWEPAEVLDTTVFPLGVQSGDPTPEALILWTRAAPGVALRLVLMRADGDVAWLPEHEEEGVADDAGVLKLDVTGLAEDSAYAYTFVDLVSGTRSAVGRARTAPAPTSRRKVTFAATSCTNQRQRPFPVLGTAAALNLDAFLLLGDTVYADEATSTVEYQAVWAQNYSSQGYLDLRASCPTVMTWDDHEVENVIAGSWDLPEEQFVRARDEFWRFNTVRPVPGEPFRLWRRVLLGEAVELFVLDCRSERDRDAGVYLGRAQMDWLKAGLRDSQAVWKVILNSVPIANVAAGQSSEGIWDLRDGDRWEGYPVQRAEILDHVIDEGIGGIVWLAGDLHFGAVTTLEREGRWAEAIEVFAGPAGNEDSNPGFNLLETGPPFRFFTGLNNVVWFEADPVARRLKVRFLGEDGAVLYEEELRG